MQHTICTQNAHRTHTHNAQNRIQNNNTTIMQHREDNREQDTENNTDTETNNPAQENTQPQHTCSAHNYRTYSLDYYQEFAYIKNSNTIELYTILQDKV